MEEIEYKFFYKHGNIKWKYFFLNARNDDDAIKEASVEAAKIKPDRWGLERIVTKRVRLI